MKKLSKNWFLEKINNVKKIFKNKELWYFISMFTSWLLSFFCIMWSILSMLVSYDLVARIEKQESEIEKLTYTSVKYKMMFEDLYDTYVYPQGYVYEEVDYER